MLKRLADQGITPVVKPFPNGTWLDPPPAALSHRMQELSKPRSIKQKYDPDNVPEIFLFDKTKLNASSGKQRAAAAAASKGDFVPPQEMSVREQPDAPVEGGAVGS